MTKVKNCAIKFVSGHAHAMIECRCGDVFHAAGSSASVRRKQRTWEARHRNCTEKTGEGRKVFWLSFANAERPKGQQFLGACIVEVTAIEADESEIDVLLAFPFAESNAKWLHAALTKSHRLGCNPGGQVAAWEIPSDHPNLARYQLGILMDRTTIDGVAECRALNTVLGHGTR